MECSADIGSYNGTAQIRWLKNNIVAGSPLAQYYSSETVLDDPRATSNCDAFRTADNRLHFQCYVYIPGSMDWESPENQHSVGDSSADDTDGVNKDIKSTGTVTIEVFWGAAGGVVALAVVIVAIVFINRRYRLPDKTKHTKIIRSNPVFVRQTAPTYDHLTSREQTEYTEIVLAVYKTKAPRMSVFTPEKKPYTQSWEVFFSRE
ncbi:hypothetical protein MAR_020881 [Mya arenaria]|uniref:Ig-like domain-containing protein n=1 Tax=Mya arenaria TaxID=6604 RepID=A0ABY7E667_MYAAR|nr:hypothetical protein MAR_020881 [Mya arenaria]